MFTPSKLIKEVTCKVKLIKGKNIGVKIRFCINNLRPFHQIENVVEDMTRHASKITGACKHPFL